jgi:hypothetical protein
MEPPIGSGNSGFERAVPARDGDRTWTEIVKEQPIAFLAIAAAAGFVLGGGARRAQSLLILTMLGQIVVRELFGDSASLGARGKA